MHSDKNAEEFAVGIDVEGLVKVFGADRVLSNVSLHCHSGITMIAGANGAGKSTLLRCIAGLVKFDAGLIRIKSPNGVITLTPETPYALNGHRGKAIGLVSQDIHLWSMWTVLENVWRPLVDILGKRRQEAISIAEHGLAQLAVPPESWDRTPYGVDPGGLPRLSGGQLRKIALARAIAMCPSILLLDEFEAHLDTESRRNLIRILQEQYGNQQNRSVVMVTHHLDLVTDVPSQLIVLNGNEQQSQ